MDIEPEKFKTLCRAMGGNFEELDEGKGSSSGKKLWCWEGNMDLVIDPKAGMVRVYPANKDKTTRLHIDTKRVRVIGQGEPEY